MKIGAPAHRSPDPDILQHLRSAQEPGGSKRPPGRGRPTRVPPALLSLDPRTSSCSNPAAWPPVSPPARRRERGGPSAPPSVIRCASKKVPAPPPASDSSPKAVLTRRLLSDPDLNRTACVILDEFTSATWRATSALALLRRLPAHPPSPNLRLVVMSATLRRCAHKATTSAARRPVLRRRQYPLEIEYTPPLRRGNSKRKWPPLWAPSPALPEQGHVLVFLPVAAEIRRAHTACPPARPSPRLAPAASPRADPSPEEQDLASAPATRKIHPLHQCGRELHHHRGRHRLESISGEARVASHSAVVRPARLADSRNQPASAQPACRTRRTHLSRPPFASTRWRISCAVPPRTPKSRAADLAPWRSCSMPWARARFAVGSNGSTVRRRRREHATTLLSQLGALEHWPARWHVTRCIRGYALGSWKPAAAAWPKTAAP